ncbi:hypothetical protein LINGRAHAP2_LOCUS31326 [Linum grandiflorum]
MENELTPMNVDSTIELFADDLDKLQALANWTCSSRRFVVSFREWCQPGPTKIAKLLHIPVWVPLWELPHIVIPFKHKYGPGMRIKNKWRKVDEKTLMPIAHQAVDNQQADPPVSFNHFAIPPSMTFASFQPTSSLNEDIGEPFFVPLSTMTPPIISISTAEALQLFNAPAPTQTLGSSGSSVMTSIVPTSPTNFINELFNEPLQDAKLGNLEKTEQMPKEKSSDFFNWLVIVSDGSDSNLRRFSRRQAK